MHTKIKRRYPAFLSSLLGFISPPAFLANISRIFLFGRGIFLNYLCACASAAGVRKFKQLNNFRGSPTPPSRQLHASCWHASSVPSEYLFARTHYRLNGMTEALIVMVWLNITPTSQKRNRISSDLPIAAPWSSDV